MMRESSKKMEDHMVRAYDDHEESVYAVSWACKDTWLFASLSYDGRIVANLVPQDEIDKILLKE
jgi:EARP and GARP complex-interacting protein 1